MEWAYLRRCAMCISHKYNFDGICRHSIHFENCMFDDSMIQQLSIDVCARCIFSAFGCWCQAFASILRFFRVFSSQQKFVPLSHNSFFHLRWLNACRDWYLPVLPFANTHLHRRCGTTENLEIKSWKSTKCMLNAPRNSKTFVGQSQSCDCGERCSLSCMSICYRKTNTIKNSIVGLRVYAIFAINLVWMRKLSNFR